MYLVTVLGNLLIILAVSSDSHLHIQMYFFFSYMSLVDSGFIHHCPEHNCGHPNSQQSYLLYGLPDTEVSFYHFWMHGLYASDCEGL
ncbi:Olfactory receptor 7E24 [Sciurus carolinensis]|uniref:Olfactory receptor 7E24 n=1 Tax=Sciurus carolinensis TaxID=30640 RepID=A0AA41TAT7_SCICA|nr:Olfactory receptor 7E24 [Sciurus carolinensis]